MKVDDQSSSVNDIASGDAAAGGDARLAELERLVLPIAREHGPAPAVPDVSAPVPTETDDAATMTTPHVWVSITLKLSATCVAVAIEVAKLAAFMNAVGKAACESNFVDVQIYLQRRHGRKASEQVEIFGLILDIDMTSVDPLASFLAAGLPTPACWWPTRHGYKGAWCFNHKVDAATFEMIAQEFAVAVPGADPGSWLVTQAQHLPVGWKDTPDGVVNVELPASQSNGIPLDVDSYTPSLPSRLARAVAGAKKLTDVERRQVEDWLADHEIDAPDTPGRAVYDSCPASEKHDASCCYVYRQEDDSIDITCHGGHGGEGKKFWNEIVLYREATGEQLSHAEVDALDDIPFTWAGVELIASKFKVALAAEEFASAIIAAACAVWQRAKAARILRRLIRKAGAKGLSLGNAMLDVVLDINIRRTRGPRALRLVHHHGQQVLGHVRADESFQRTKTSKATLSVGDHLHEWRSTLGIDADIEVIDEEERTAIIMAKVVEDGASSFNKVLGGGDPTFLAALGIPIAELYDLPLAHMKDGWSIDPVTKCLRWIRTARLKPGDPTFDVVGYFIGLYRAGRLPLASENDVRLFVIALAIGLLRAHAPGLIGVFWFIGPSGAGKDYLAHLLCEIWRAAVDGNVVVAFDLHGTDDLEQSRCFASAGDAVFARAREAGKRAALIERLIQVAGTTHVTARDMQKLARNIPNTFVPVADSVEDLPERREISRRTVTINVEHVADTRDRGELTAEIVDRAPDIMASLLRIVESRPLDFYIKYPNKTSRPTLPVALADVFGATLPEVTGASLSELFGHIAVYTSTFAQFNEHKPKGRQKDGKESTLFPLHSMTHMIGTMERQDASRHFFRHNDSPRKIMLLIQREQQDPKKKYLRIMVDSTWYAFKVIPKSNNFVFEKEIDFRTKLGLGPDEQGETLGDEADVHDRGQGAGDSDNGAAAGDGPPARDADREPATSADSMVPQGPRKGPLRFSFSAPNAEQPAETEANDAAKRR